MIAINICTQTKSGDVYKEVAINAFPIIASSEEQIYSKEFREHLQAIIHKSIYDKCKLNLRNEQNETKSINLQQILQEYE